jgi:hypothetical protein
MLHHTEAFAVTVCPFSLQPCHVGAKGYSVAACLHVVPEVVCVAGFQTVVESVSVYLEVAVRQSSLVAEDFESGA